MHLHLKILNIYKLKNLNCWRNWKEFISSFEIWPKIQGIYLGVLWKKFIFSELNLHLTIEESDPD